LDFSLHINVGLYMTVSVINKMGFYCLHNINMRVIVC